MEYPLIVVALLFIVAYAWDVIGNLHGAADLTAQLIIWGTWAVFVVDYVVQLVLAERRWHWFYTHLLEFFVVVLPVLRPLRLLRLVTLWTVLQRAATGTLRGRVAMYVIATASMLIFIAALAVLEAERGAVHAHIKNFGDALWWAFATISTVGYGDLTPVTATGRLVAVALMIAGVATLGVVTATLASWLVSKVTEAEVDTEVADGENQLHSQLADLAAEVRSLRAELAAAGTVRE